MGGKGSSPKDPTELSLKAKKDKPFINVVIEKTPQPFLEELLGEINSLTGKSWSRPTLLLWSQLADFPSMKDMLPAQWSSFARAFMLDDALISGDVKVAAEARLRMAKYGIDPDDLMRMRIKITADEKPSQGVKTTPANRKLRLIKDLGGDGGNEKTGTAD